MSRPIWTEADVARIRRRHRREALPQPASLPGSRVRLILPLFGTNDMWCQATNGRRVKTQAYRDWQRLVGQRVLADWPRDVPRPLAGRLRVRIAMIEVGRARRDIDGPVKPVLDALERAGAYVNDNQIDEVRLVRQPLGETPHLEVTLWVL